MSIYSGGTALLKEQCTVQACSEVSRGSSKSSFDAGACSEATYSTDLKALDASRQALCKHYTSHMREYHRFRINWSRIQLSYMRSSLKMSSSQKNCVLLSGSATLTCLRSSSAAACKLAVSYSMISMLCFGDKTARYNANE